jgi:WD40 repeat protein
MERAVCPLVAVLLLGTATAQVSERTYGYASRVLYSPDGQLLLTLPARDPFATLRDAKSGKVIHTLRLDAGLIVQGAAFSPDGRRVATADWSGSVRVWETATGQETLRLKGHQGRAACVAFSPDSRRLVSGGDDQMVRVWELASGGQAAAFAMDKYMVSAVAYDPRGTRVASADLGGVVKVWDLRTGTAVLTVGDYPDYEILRFSPNGRQLAAAGPIRHQGEPPGRVTVWDTATGKELYHRDGPASLAYSPDGSRLATVTRSHARTDAKNGEQTLVAGEIQICDSRNGGPFLRMRAKDPCDIAYSPDGRRLACLKEDGSVEILDISRLPAAK